MQFPTSTLGSPTPSTPFSIRRSFNKAASSFILSFSLIVVILFVQIASAQTSAAPTAPYALSASAASCGEVALSWAPSVDNSGTGLKAYTIWRSNDGVNTVTSIAADRTWFNDTINIRSSDAMTYYVIAVDNAGNKSPASSSVAVSTPACPLTAGEQVADSAYTGPLGKTIASFGSVTAILYQKLNSLSQRETWIYLSDTSSGQSSKFLLHPYPGYSQAETDYVLTSTSDLWTLSSDMSTGGHLLVTQYKLNGTPANSATLVSTQSLGSSSSVGRSLIRLSSGALLVGWDDEPPSSVDLNTGFAYRSAAGSWTVKYPVTIANSGLGGSITKSRMAIAQHPADGSIWAYVKRDSFHSISALHFTEIGNDISVDWIKPGFIQDATCSDSSQACYYDGDNGPEAEFPFVTAMPDPTRNAILLAYQGYQNQIVYVDPLYGSMSNNMFLKQAKAVIAEIAPDGSKSFIPTSIAIERVSPFGMTVDSNGSIWLAYQPIDSGRFTWNEVFTSKYDGSSWSNPTFVGLDYQNYNTGNGLNDCPSLVFRPDQPQVAFRTPDLKLHSMDLSNLSAAPAPVADTTVPAATITSPSSGATLNGTAIVSVTASDNVGVTQTDLIVDGVVLNTASSASASFTWDTTNAANGSHALQARAYDAAGNVGFSPITTVTVSNSSLSNLSITITSPGNGSKVPRNQRVSIQATVTDGISVSKVQFLVNKKLLCSFTGAPYTCMWKVPAKIGVVYNIQAIATDTSGTTASQLITVTAQ